MIITTRPASRVNLVTNPSVATASRETLRAIDTPQHVLDRGGRTSLLGRGCGSLAFPLIASRRRRTTVLKFSQKRRHTLRVDTWEQRTSEAAHRPISNYPASVQLLWLLVSSSGPS